MMIVSGVRLINARRLDLESKRDAYVQSALKSGLPWEEAQEVGEKAVPKSEFEYLDKLARMQSKSEYLTVPLFVSLLITLLVVGGGASLWLWG